MSLIETTYEIPKGMENSLRFWLARDAWGIDEATQIITGIDPDKTIKPSANKNSGTSHIFGSITLFNGCRLPYLPEKVYKIVGGEFSDSLELVDDENFDEFSDDLEHERHELESNALKAYFGECNKIARLFNNPSTTPTSPEEWIERAISKRINIPWLKTAQARGILPDGLNGKIIAIDESGLVRLIDKPTSDKNAENPKARRERIRARVREEDAKGTKAFLQVVAEEEGVSKTRIKQLIQDESEKGDAPLNKTGLNNSPWTDLSTNTRQTSSKKSSSKY